MPTYRVFEQEWRQVILLWIGRRDEVVTDEFKEEFIDKLTNFREQEGEFYYYRAYCMAAICVGEFKSSQRTEEIIQQIVTWAFGYFNTEKQEWRTYLKPISSLVRETIPFTHRRCAIDTLLALLENPALGNWLRSSVAEALGRIAVDDSVAIDTLLALLENPAIEYELQSHLLWALGEILTLQTMPLGIWQLKNNITDEVYNSNFNSQLK